MRPSCAFGMPMPCVLDAHPRRVRRRAGDLHGDLRLSFRILHGVIEEVGDRGAQVLDVAVDDERRLQIVADDRDGAVGEVMARARGVDAFLDQPAEIDRGAMFEPALLARHAGAQHLFDRVLQAIGVLQHDAIELLALRVADLARLQRFEVQADRRNRRLELVRDRIEEAVLLLGDAHLADQEHRVDDEAGDDQARRWRRRARAARRAAR